MSILVYLRGTTSYFVYRKNTIAIHNKACIGRRVHKYTSVVAWESRRTIDHGVPSSSRVPCVAMPHGFERAEAIPLFAPKSLNQHKKGLMQQLFPGKVA